MTNNCKYDEIYEKIKVNTGLAMCLLYRKCCLTVKCETTLYEYAIKKQLQILIIDIKL